MTDAKPSAEFRDLVRDTINDSGDIVRGLEKPSAEERRAERFVHDWFDTGTSPKDLPNEREALKEWLVESFAAHAYDAEQAAREPLEQRIAELEERLEDQMANLAKIAELEHELRSERVQRQYAEDSNEGLEREVEQRQRLQPLDRQGRPISQGSANRLMAAADEIKERLSLDVEQWKKNTYLWALNADVERKRALDMEREVGRLKAENIAWQYSPTDRLEAARAEGRREAINAVCILCANGHEPTERKPGWWEHKNYPGAMARTLFCNAAAIRALAEGKSDADAE